MAGDTNFNSNFVKFHQRDRFFESFKNLSLERAMEVKREYEVRNIETNGIFKLRKYEYTNYDKVLSFLTNPLIHTLFSTFDERALFMIFACDPELKIYKNYMASTIPGLKRKQKLYSSFFMKESTEINDNLANARKDFEVKCRQDVNFYDAGMVGYESAYFKKFLMDKELLPKYGSDLTYLLNEAFRKCSSLALVSDERIKEINEKVKNYISTVGEIDNNTLIYHIFYQNELLGLKNAQEKLLFYILVLDPKLDMYQIFINESTWQNIFEKAIEEFKFVSRDIIRFEGLLAPRLYPNKKFEFGAEKTVD